MTDREVAALAEMAVLKARILRLETDMDSHSKALMEIAKQVKELSALVAVASVDLREAARHVRALIRRDEG
jgi:hypothetical protein